MDTPDVASATRPVPWGLAGTIGLVIVVELVLAAHHLDFTRFYIHDWRAAGSAVQGKSSGCALLCFGDSLVKFGVLPRVIQERTGERGYNLAVCGGQAASSYFLLRRTLDTQTRPSVVLADFAPHLLAASPKHNLRQWPELLSLRETVELGLRSRHAGFFAELMLGTVLPSVKAREEIRGSVLAAIKGKPPSRRADVLQHCRIWDSNLGADVHPDRPNYQGEIDAADRGYFPPAWSCHPVNAYFLERFLELAAKNQVRVVWLLPPVTPNFQLRREELGLEASYLRFLATLSAKHPNLSIIDARHVGFDHSQFVDPLHLNRRGAETLSTRIAVALSALSKEPSSPGHWINLGHHSVTHSMAPLTPIDPRTSTVAFGHQTMEVYDGR